VGAIERMASLIVKYHEKLAKGHEEAAIDLLTVSPSLPM
jgi:hypothetical protein